MPAEQSRLSVDEGVDFINQQHGVPLTHDVLVDICESGWDACRHERKGDWSIDRSEASEEATARVLMERVARLASERQDAADAMDDPPAGAEADQGI